MFRKLLGGLTSTAVVAGLVSAGVIATAAPAAADTQFPAVDGGLYNNTKTNPDLASKCGLEFGLVLDSSGSIGGAMTNLKTAANAFVDALVDTGSKVAVTSFSSSSPGSGGTNLEPTPLTTGNLTTIKGSYQGLSSNGSTNWEAGLGAMQNLFSAGSTPFSGGAPDLVIVITDGNPNRNNNGSAPPDGSKAATNPAIAIANAMKTQSVHMFGIAVGSVTLNPIKAITYDTQYTSNPSNFGTADFMNTSDYAALKKDLESIAADLCGSSVTITKQLKTPGTDFQPASGWNFKTTVTSPNADGKWVLPDTAPTGITAGQASTKELTTGANGTATFKWQPQGANNTTPVIVEEDLTGKGDYERDPVLACTKSNVSGGSSTNFNVTIGQDGTWNLTTALGSALTPGDRVTCTAQNTLTQLNLKKTVRTGPATAAQFQLTATPINASGAPTYDRPGNYTTYDPIHGDVWYQLSESGPVSGDYTGTWSCTNGVTPNAFNQIQVPKGTQTRCEVTNDRKTGTLTLRKTVTPVGSAAPEDWILTATPQSITGQGTVSGNGKDGVTNQSVFTGTYALSENAGPGGFDQDGDWVCTGGTMSQDKTKVTVGQGDNVTCTVTNKRKTGTLTLRKTVTPVGSAAPEDWILTATPQSITGQGTVSGNGKDGVTNQSVFTGTYALSENAGPGGFDQDGDWVCTGGTMSQDKTKVTVGQGDNVTCTVTNKRKTGTLTLRKTVTPVGSAAPEDWILTATPQSITGQGTVSGNGKDGVTNQSVFTGTYALSENAGPGGFDQDGDWVCTGGTMSQDKTKVTVGQGDNVTCTVTNKRKTGTLTLRKTVTPVGSAAPEDWILTATPQSITGQGTVSGNGKDGVTNQSVFTGTYALSENAGPGGFDQDGDWVCTGGTMSQDKTKVTVGQGDNVTCTVTNKRKTGTLTLRKTVTPVGSAAPEDWILTATPQSITGQGTVSGNGKDGVTNQSVFTGTYALSENAGPGGFDQDGDWVCTGGTMSQDKTKVTVGQGDNVTCTVTNKRKTGTLTLRKTVTPVGSAAPEDWILTATPQSITGQGTVSGNGKDGVTNQSVFTGTYALSENAGPGGFDQDGDWVCTGGTMSQDKTKVTVGQGDNVTCTVTNKRKTGTLTLRKTVTPVGSAAPEDWILTATPQSITGQGTVSGNGKDGVTNQSVFTGTYALSENAGPGGFDQDGDWVCTGGTMSQDKTKVTVGQGDNVTCTVTNKRKTGTLTLRKTVKTGPAAPEDWILTATPQSITGQGTVSGNGKDGVTNQSVFTGTYALSENAGPGDYSQDGDWVCTGGTMSQDKTKVTVGQGDNVTCTVTNTRDTAKLSLVKQVDGKGDPADWTLTATPDPAIPGQGVVSGNGDPNSQDAVKEEVVFTGTYALSEDGPDKYTPGEWVCLPLTNGDNQVARADLADALNTGDSIKLEKGDNIVCTIVNFRNYAQLKLVKEVSGGKAAADDFTLSADADAPDTELNFSNKGGSGDFQKVYAQTQYTLSETGPGGYTAGEWVCEAEDVPSASAFEQTGDTITLDRGEKVTCTITNTRDLGSLKITKKFDPKSSGYDKAFTIGYQCGDDPAQTVSLKAGQSETITGIPTGTECQVSEVKPADPPDGWSFSDPTFDPANGKVTVAEKDKTVSVTVTNEILKPGINIVKTGSATQVNPGDTVTYTYTVTNTGDTDVSDVKVSDDKCAPVTYKSGDTNGDSKLQTSETWTFTCSTKITVATTNTGTVTGKDKNGKTVTATDTFTVSVVSPVVTKKICPITVTLVKPKPTKVGNRVIVKKIKTKTSSCKLLKPVVLCRPLASNAAGEKAFCDTKVTKKGKIRVKTRGYDKVKVTVIVRAKPKKGYEDRYKPNTWRKTWILR